MLYLLLLNERGDFMTENEKNLIEAILASVGLEPLRRPKKSEARN